jgi:hypothetical protein
MTRPLGLVPLETGVRLAACPDSRDDDPGDGFSRLTLRLLVRM